MIDNNIDIAVFIVIPSFNIQYVMNGKVSIPVANPNNLTDHKFPNPSYPYCVVNQKP